MSSFEYKTIGLKLKGFGLFSAKKAEGSTVRRQRLHWRSSERSRTHGRRSAASVRGDSAGVALEYFERLAT